MLAPTHRVALPHGTKHQHVIPLDDHNNQFLIFLVLGHSVRGRSMQICRAEQLDVDQGFLPNYSSSSSSSKLFPEFCPAGSVGATHVAFSANHNFLFTRHTGAGVNCGGINFFELVRSRSRFHFSSINHRQFLMTGEIEPSALGPHGLCVLGMEVCEEQGVLIVVSTQKCYVLDFSSGRLVCTSRMFHRIAGICHLAAFRSLPCDLFFGCQDGVVRRVKNVAANSITSSSAPAVDQFPVVEQRAKITEIALSPDGRSLAACHGASLKVYAVETAELICAMTHLHGSTENTLPTTLRYLPAHSYGDHNMTSLCWRNDLVLVALCGGVQAVSVSVPLGIVVDRQQLALNSSSSSSSGQQEDIDPIKVSRFGDSSKLVFYRNSPQTRSIEISSVDPSLKK